MIATTETGPRSAELDLEDARISAFRVRELWSEYRSGDESARENLVLNYAPMVKVVAGRLGSRLPAQVEESDLISFGLTGLLGAIERYDPERSARFETFALYRIRGAMLDALRTLDWVPRRVRRNAREIERAESRLRAKLGKAPGEADLAGHLRIEVAQLREWLLEIADSQIFSFDAPLPGVGGEDSEGGGRLSDLIADDGVDEPQRALDEGEGNGAVGRAISVAVAELPRRQQFILRCRYREDLRMREIGEVLGLTESRVSQLHAKSLISLRAAIGLVEGEENRHLAHAWN